LVADDRAGVLSGEILLEGVERVELAPELGEYLLVLKQNEEGLRVVFAGARAVEGAGEMIRLYGTDLTRARVHQAQFNDGWIEAHIVERTLAVRPMTTVLYGNAPNPFNPETIIRFDLAHSGAVRLELFDVLGQKVKTLVAESLPAGTHQVVWHGVDEEGIAVSSGVYFYRLQAGNYTQMRRMLLLK
jgi:hypothetical protein